MTHRLTTLILGLALLSVQPLFASTDDPSLLVSETAGKLLESLDENREAYLQDPDQLRAVVREDLLPILDVRYSARLILGRAGRGISEPQLDAFSTAMSDVLINRYADGLVEYKSREQLEVLPLRAEPNPKMTRVQTRIRLLNGKHIPVDYMFRMSDGEWKIFDVLIEGISYVTTYRNQIMPLVQERGIDVVTAQIGTGELQLGN